MLKATIVDWGPKPFSTLDVWINVKGFNSEIKRMWNPYTIKPNRMVSLKEKIRNMKNDFA